MLIVKLFVFLLAFVVVATLALACVILAITLSILLAWVIPKAIRREEISDADWLSFTIFLQSIFPTILYSAVVFTLATLGVYFMTHQLH